MPQAQEATLSNKKVWSHHPLTEVLGDRIKRECPTLLYRETIVAVHRALLILDTSKFPRFPPRRTNTFANM